MSYLGGILLLLGMLVVVAGPILSIFGSSKGRITFRRGLMLMLAGVVVVVLGAVFDASPTQPRTNSATSPAPQRQADTIYVTASSSIEEKLAALERNAQILPSWAIVPYRIGLDRLVPKCTESRDHIGDMALVGQRLIKENIGQEISILAFLDALNEAIPDGTQLKCTDVAAALVALWR